MVRTKLWAGLLVSACTVAVHADSVFLADGTEVSGTVVEDNANSIVIRRANGTLQSYRKADVETIVYDTVKRPLSKGVVVGKREADKPVGAAGKDVSKAKEEAQKIAAKPGAPEEEKKTAVNEQGPITRQAEPTEAKPGPDGLPPSATVQLDPKKAGEATKAPATAPADAKVTTVGPKADPKADPKAEAKPDAKKDDKKDATASKEPEWTPPPGLAGFPDKAPRMKKEQEEEFMAVFAALDSNDSAQRSAAKARMASFGPDVLPYAIAAAQHARVEARASAMDVIGQLPNSGAALKWVIELMYSALPAEGEPASWQVPYLRSCKTTLHASAGRSFISVEPGSALVQVGMKEAIKFYNENIDRLPKQISDPKLDETAPDYLEKLKKARALNLAKREWPRPPMATDIVTRDPQGPGRRNITAQDVVTPTDDNNANRAMPEVDRNSAINRGRDAKRAADPRDSALNRKN